MKIVVVGAASGLGRSAAIGLGQRGNQIALLARRFDRVVEAAAEAGSGSVGIACDATDESSARSAIAEAAETLGGIDALIYTPGTGPLGRIAEVDRDTWHRVFDTNVVGASLITAAVLPHLEASGGRAAYLSSISASTTPPWPGPGVYAVTKAALDKLVEAWRAEHPHVGFTRVTVGDCAGGEGLNMTEFANGWDVDLAMEFHPVWMSRNYMTGTLMDVEELIGVLDMVVHCGASATIPTVAVVPRPLPPTP